MFKVKRKNSKGLTLIEAAMVLAIATLVIAGIMIFFQSSNISSKSRQVMSELTDLQNSIRTLYSGQPDYTGLNVAALIDSRSVPAKMINGAELRNSFNGTIDIVPTSLGTGSNNGFTITFNSIPSESCVRIAGLDQGRAMVEMTVGGTAVTLPATPDVVTPLCTAAAMQTLAWTYR